VCTISEKFEGTVIVRISACLFGIALLMSAAGAAAEVQVVGPRGTRTSLKVFEDADGKTELATVSVKNLTFPITVYETSERGFVRVKLDGKQVWLNTEQVRIPAGDIPAECLTVSRADAGVTTAGLRGANAGCK
jgi:hypothetical protein